MINKFSSLVGIVCVVFSTFSQEKTENNYWYTSPDTKGYISIQKIDKNSDNKISTTINSTVKATFNDEKLDFSLTTINDGDKMVAPTYLNFNGTIDSNMKPVRFTGNRIKKDRKNDSYWSFEGDFIDEMEKDPDFKPYTTPNHKAILRIPDRTIPSFNLWAIIPNLPFDRKGTFIFNGLDETKLYVRKNQTINYLGTTKVKIHGENILLHKFVHQGKKMIPAYFWVNENRVLVQVLLDNKYTFTISNKETALESKTIADTNN